MKNILIIYILCIVFFSSCQDKSAKEEQGPLPVLLSNAEHKASSVYLTKDENNFPVASWCEADPKTEKKYFFLAFYDKEKNAFSTPVPVPIEQNASIHEEGMPKIAVKGNGTIMAIYETSSPTTKNEWAGFVHYIISTDKGKSWTNPVCVHADTLPGKSRSFAGITRLSDGEIGACWLDESFNYTKQGRPVKFARTNAANIFEHEIVVDSLACECCRIAISSNDNGKISVAYRDIINDSIRDMSVSTSVDNGNSFSPAVSFSKDGWVINGCPHNGPSVVNNDNNIYATWFTGGPKKGIYYGELDSNKETLTKQLVTNQGRYIQICLLGDGERILAFNESVREGDSLYSKIVLNKIDGNIQFTEDITSTQTHASYPVVRSFGKSNVVVAWTEKEKVYCKILDASLIKNTLPKFMSSTETPAGIPVIKLAVAKDVVCGMTVDADAEDTVHYNNKVYGFCSKECKGKFSNNPSSYLAAR